MKKYEVIENVCEVAYKDRYSIKRGVTADQDDQPGKTVVKSFDTKEEALAELKKLNSDVTRRSGYFDIVEYYVEENDYDEEGEWISGGDIWEFSPFRIGVTDSEKLETIAVFDDYKDAEKFYENLEIDAYIEV